MKPYGMMQIRRTSFLIAFYLISSSTSAEGTPTDLTIFTEHFPPYNFEHDQKIIGINADIVKQLCMRSKINCHFEILPWTRAFENTLITPNSALVSTSRSKKREQMFKWVGKLVNSKTYFYRLRERTDINPDNLLEASNYTVGILRNDVYQSALTNNGFTEGKNLIEFSYKNDDVKLFMAGKIDMIIGSELTIPYQLEDSGYSADSVSLVLELPITILGGNYLALNKLVPDTLVNKLQQQLELMRANHEIDEIINTYRAHQTKSKNIE
jgi:polar amino acid transport system substrate-binding protein